MDWALALAQNQSGSESLLYCHQMAMPVSTLCSLSFSLPSSEIYIIKLKAGYIQHLLQCLLYNEHKMAVVVTIILLQYIVIVILQMQSQIQWCEIIG